MKTQVGLRLSVEVWDKIRTAAKLHEVSAANLMDALASEWLMGMQLDDPWARGVLSSAQEREKMTRNRPRRRNNVQNLKYRDISALEL